MTTNNVSNITNVVSNTSVNSIGGCVKIQTQTASSSASINFTGLSNIYARYDFVLGHINLGTDNKNLLLKVSTDNGSTWLGGSNYNTNGISYNRVSVAGYGADGQASVLLSPAATMTNSVTDADMNGTIWMTTPAAASASSYFNYVLMYYNGSTGWVSCVGMGAAYASNTINAVQFIADSGTIASGSFTLLGYLA